MSDLSEKPEPQFERPNFDQEGERLVLAAAEAIRNLVADRRSLRETVAAQERELIRLRASNTELWRHVALIHGNYRRLATEFFTQLQRMDARSAPPYRLSSARGPLRSSSIPSRINRARIPRD